MWRNEGGREEMFCINQLLMYTVSCDLLVKLLFSNVNVSPAERKIREFVALQEQIEHNEHCGNQPVLWQIEKKIYITVYVSSVQGMQVQKILNSCTKSIIMPLEVKKGKGRNMVWLCSLA